MIVYFIHKNQNYIKSEFIYNQKFTKIRILLKSEFIKIRNKILVNKIKNSDSILKQNFLYFLFRITFKSEFCELKIFKNFSLQFNPHRNMSTNMRMYKFNKF